MKITFLGQAGLLFEKDGKKIMIDPYFSDSVGKKNPKKHRRVPVENSLHLARAMAHAGVPFEMHIFPKGWHGLGLAQNFEEAKEWPGLCQQWLLGLGFGKE